MAQRLPMLSEVIAQLQALAAVHGEVPVVLRDADTSWPMVPTVAYSVPGATADRDWQALGPCVIVAGGYDAAATPILPGPSEGAYGRE